MSDDLIDIYDANLRLVGKKDRKQAHYDGEWHRTFHCWVIADRRGRPCVLFQMRSPRMRNFPGLLDVSAAGHLAAGESTEDGIREVMEELGIPVDRADVIYIGDRVEVADQDNGQRNREYQAVHLLRLHANRQTFKPDPHEIHGLYWMNLSEGLDFFAGRRRQIHLEGIALNADSEYKESAIEVDIAAFLPRFQRYYLAALVASERLLEGKHDIAIS